jgi:hypothetical protein
VRRNDHECCQSCTANEEHVWVSKKKLQSSCRALEVVKIRENDESMMRRCCVELRSGYSVLGRFNPRSAGLLSHPKNALRTARISAFVCEPLWRNMPGSDMPDLSVRQTLLRAPSRQTYLRTLLNPIYGAPFHRPVALYKLTHFP